ncbi:MAG: hypothetical protein IJT14_00425, partial [Rickettsiales bacterium]|nr:hypothetical protein [Rickettsiales bacterium]
HFASLDVRGLWHARPLPTASALDKSRPAAAQLQFQFFFQQNNHFYGWDSQFIQQKFAINFLFDKINIAYAAAIYRKWTV